MDDSKTIIGIIDKQIKDVHLDSDERQVTIEFSDGTGIIIGAHGRYCEDVWLEWDCVVGRPFEHLIVLRDDVSEVSEGKSLLEEPPESIEVI